MTQEDIDLFMESVDIGYTRCDVKPISGDWLVNPTITNRHTQCCGMMAALINKNGLETYADQDTNFYNLIAVVKNEFNLSKSFFEGFLTGFDADVACETNPEYMSGYLCGKEKREKWILKEKQQ
jgi:hypothetical protein